MENKKMEVRIDNERGFTVNLSLDGVDFVMAAQLIDNLKQDFNIDLTIEELFYYLLRYDFVEMEIYKKHLYRSEAQK